MPEIIPEKRRAQLIRLTERVLAASANAEEDVTHRSRQPMACQHNPQRENRRHSDHQADAQDSWHQAG